MTPAWLLLVALAAPACGGAVTHRVEVYPAGAPKRWLCGDGLPVRVLQDVRCVDGVCGFTCAPERWTTPPGCPD